MNKLEIREELIKLADNKYKKFHSSLCPGVNNMLGVRIPNLRLLAKKIINSDNYKEFIEQTDCIYYEEIMLQGMIIGMAKMDVVKTCNYLRNFIKKINNWAVCDTLCAGLKITNKNLEYIWNFINKYINSTQEFEVRFAVVMMLDFYINENYIDKVLEKLNNINHDGYYVKMAVAWAISIAFIKEQEKTMYFLNNNKLDKFTYNKALQKIIESYRVDEHTKSKIHLMKR